MAISFLSAFSNEHQNVPPVNHQQKCLINGICGVFDVKSNYFDSLVPLKKILKKFHKRAIKCKNCVSIKRSKTTLL